MIQLKRLLLIVAAMCPSALAADFSGLSKITPGTVRAENGLWIEVPLERQFKSRKAVTVAEMTGPGVITMIHFALPHMSLDKEKYRMNRDTLIQMYWDGEAEPSVNVPFVDFFCDPMAEREQFETALVNKRRGWNAYFPMPFRKSARIVLVYEGPEGPGQTLWRMMPCYSYVMWRETKGVEPDEGYFHAQWRQQPVLTGKADYVALEAAGTGKFIGWNVTVRRPGKPSYPVDMNEAFYVDGEEQPRVEFQGIEDSFGFSWGFPETENLFAMTGYWPFLRTGAAAYRWFINDSISFEKSLKVAIGYGEHEDPSFREQFSKIGTELQFSSTCYWYQTEPHAPFPPMVDVVRRGPAADDRFWLHPEERETDAQLKQRGVKMQMLCGRPKQEVVYAEPGYGASAVIGFAFEDWLPPMYHARMDFHTLTLRVDVPPTAKGKLRLYIIDPDNYAGGRREQILVDGKDLGEFKDFQKGRWVELEPTSEMIGDGTLQIQAKSLNGNAVISVVEWVEKT